MGVPDALAPFHRASQPERDRRVRRVLVDGWRLYRRGDVSMVQAIGEAAGQGAESEYAKITLRRILLELNLTAWEEHPMRTRADVHDLFRRAVSKLTLRRAGWRVSP